MKQNITVAIDSQLLKRARGIAAQRNLSVSGLLTSELLKIVTTATTYEAAKARALARLESPFRLGGKGIKNRGALHDRKNLR